MEKQVILVEDTVGHVRIAPNTQTIFNMEKQVILVEDTVGYVSMPKQQSDVAAGYDVSSIEVKMIAHNGWVVTCRSHGEIVDACKKLRKMDRRSWWKRFKMWLRDEQPLKGWKQLWFNTGLKTAPENIMLYISAEPCSRTVKTDYSLHNSLGTIDNDYRGYIYLIYHANWTTYDDESIIRLFNTCGQLKGKISIPLEFRRSETLPVTNRGEGGFGSTEKK